MSVTFDNTVFAGGQSELGAFALSSFTGTGALSGAAPVTINGTIDQPGSLVTINLNLANLTAVGATGTYLGYSNADANGNHIYYFSVTGAGLTTPVTVGVTTGAAVPVAGLLVPVDTSNVSAPVCFAAGTLILTTRGEVAVEALRVGDTVVTASGRHRPIVWMGSRAMALGSGPESRATLPIRIRADAIAPGMPRRDLVVSPGHRLYVDAVLVQASALVNGATILREDVRSIDYWHVELESHDILVAEGLPSESYMESANRASFDNGDVVFGHRPVTRIAGAGSACAPLVDDGPRLEAIRDRLFARARALRAQTRAGDRDVIRDPGVSIVADGHVLTPTMVADHRFQYDVPPGTAYLALRSRSACPHETQPGSSDRRRLGVCLTDLELDGVPVSVGDPRLEIGWHEPEDGGRFRWTDGDADLPVARRLVFRATPLPVYQTAAPAVAPSVRAAG